MTILSPLAIGWATAATLVLVPPAAFIPAAQRPAERATTASTVPTDSAIEDITLPVEDITLPIEDLVFGEASLDGAVADLGQRFELDANVLFAFNKATLTARARTEIATIAAKARERGATSLHVAGHTDNQGGTAYNQRLSAARANAVKSALVGQLPGVTITAKGYGESQPIADNKTKAGQALNRRVEITLG